jgi:hypothetical protein
VQNENTLNTKGAEVKDIQFDSPFSISFTPGNALIPGVSGQFWALYSLTW